MQQAKTDQPDDDEVDGYNEVEQARHDQDQDASNQGHDGRDMRRGNGHRGQNSGDAVMRGESFRGGHFNVACSQIGDAAFREYVIREHVPTYTVPDRVIVGAVLPDTGVTYYDVPQTYGVTPYRYTVVNGETVLVEPRSRRIVQIVD
jgi:hypothetical protein